MDRRKHRRADITVDVRIETPTRIYSAVARDISSRGIFLELEGPIAEPEVREVELHFEIDTGIQTLSRRIGGYIVRGDAAGLAVRFAEQDILARAVVHELMYYIQVTRQEDGMQNSQDLREAARGASGGHAA